MPSVSINSPIVLPSIISPTAIKLTRLDGVGVGRGVGVAVAVGISSAIGVSISKVDALWFSVSAAAVDVEVGFEFCWIVDIKGTLSPGSGDARQAESKELKDRHKRSGI